MRTPVGTRGEWLEPITPFWYCPACRYVMTEAESKGYKSCPAGVHHVQHVAVPQLITDTARKLFADELCWKYAAAQILTVCAKVGAEKMAAADDIAGWLQSVLTALNVGDVKSGSPLHLKVREVMIAYRAAEGSPNE